MTTYHEYAESNGLAHETTLDTFTAGTTEHRLVYLPAGDYPAGSRLRRESDPRWGVLWTLRDGTTGGRTYRDETTARAEWDAKRERLLDPVCPDCGDPLTDNDCETCIELARDHDGPGGWHVL